MVGGAGGREGVVVVCVGELAGGAGGGGELAGVALGGR